MNDRNRLMGHIWPTPELAELAERVVGLLDTDATGIERVAYTIRMTNPQLGEFGRALGRAANVPTGAWPNYHAFITNGKVSVFLQGPSMVATVKYEEK